MSTFHAHPSVFLRISLHACTHDSPVCCVGALTEQLSDLLLTKTCVAHLSDIVIEHTRVPRVRQEHHVDVSCMHVQCCFLCIYRVHTALCSLHLGLNVQHQHPNSDSQHLLGYIPVCTPWYRFGPMAPSPSRGPRRQYFNTGR